eukprot:scaffold24060_cov50-Attheya_sp.AAC.6
MNLIVTDDIQLELPEELARVIMSYWDVPTLVKKKAVCLTWKRLCTAVIDDKAPIPKKAFLSGDELRSAVLQYAVYNSTQAEEFASTYGWPIGNWDVSRVRDFSRVFMEIKTFNEKIGSWDVSNATAMHEMFYSASYFDQDLSSWDTSNVIRMDGMFYNATSFNVDISSWDTSNVTTMYSMFSHATSFNGDLSSWDSSNVTHMCYMFNNARSFNGDLSSWDTSTVTNMDRMFEGALSLPDVSRSITRKRRRDSIES